MNEQKVNQLQRLLGELTKEDLSDALIKKTIEVKELIVDGVEKELERVHKKYTLKKYNQAQQDGQLSNPDCSGGELSRVS